MDQSFVNLLRADLILDVNKFLRSSNCGFYPFFQNSSSYLRISVLLAVLNMLEYSLFAKNNTWTGFLFFFFLRERERETEFDDT